MAKVDANGNWLWVAQAGGTNEDYGMGIGSDAAGNTYLSGTFYLSCPFGTSSLTSVGQKDIFIAKLGPATAVDDELITQVVPFNLAQNSPNPFSQSTRITIEINDNQSPYSLVVYDIKGRKVFTLHDGPLSKGENILTINSSDILGDKLSSGLYYYRLSNGKSSQTKKMVLIR